MWTPRIDKLPTEDFKINLSNMTDVEKVVANKWLKKVAESRGINTRYLETYRYTVNYVWFGRNERGVCYQPAERPLLFNYIDLPELFLSFTTPEVKSWEFSNNTLQQTIDKLQAALKEAEQQLKRITCKD